MIIKRF